MKSFIERFKTLNELLSFFWQQKLWWLIPMILIMLILGLLMIFVGSTPLATLIYPLF